GQLLPELYSLQAFPSRNRECRSHRADFRAEQQRQRVPAVRGRSHHVLLWRIPKIPSSPAIMVSTSAPNILKPPRLIMSFLRSNTRTKPSASIDPISPERQKPFTNSILFASWRCQ